MTVTRDLADVARQLADVAPVASARRKAAACAAIALSESRTVTGARRVLAGWDGPADVIADALAVIDDLAADTTP